MKYSVILLMLLAPLLIGSGDTRSDQERNAIESAKLVALMFDTGRVVVGEFQELINDKSKGNKGFTSDFFAQHVIEKFEKETKLTWGNLAEESIPPQAKKLLPVLLDAQKSIIQERQTLINLKGVGFKGFIPATFGTTASLRFRSMSDVYLKQTASVVRNARNTPDQYELSVLKKFSSPSYPQGEPLAESIDGGKKVRLMVPLYYQEHCLSCHGEPKGARDKTGHPKEGGKLGEIGGAISVRLDVQ